MNQQPEFDLTRWILNHPGFAVEPKPDYEQLFRACCLVLAAVLRDF